MFSRSTAKSQGFTTTDYTVIHQVCFLFPGRDQPTSLNIYMANVQAAFLDKLDFPDKEPAVNSGLDIYHRQISTLPLQTLPRRLCRMLDLSFRGEMCRSGKFDAFQRKMEKKDLEVAELNDIAECDKR